MRSRAAIRELSWADASSSTPATASYLLLFPGVIIIPSTVGVLDIESCKKVYFILKVSETNQNGHLFWKALCVFKGPGLVGLSLEYQIEAGKSSGLKLEGGSWLDLNWILIWLLLYARAGLAPFRGFIANVCQDFFHHNPRFVHVLCSIHYYYPCHFHPQYFPKSSQFICNLCLIYICHRHCLCSLCLIFVLFLCF